MTSISRSVRVATALAAVVVSTALFTATAAAHVGVDPDQVEAGSRTEVALSVGHGCEGSPTTELNIQMPPGVNNAKPQMHPGWSASLEREELDTPIEAGHGQELTERVSVIRFVADEGSEVPDDQLDRFIVSFTAPETPGTIFFKTVQKCEEGESSWVAEWDGTGEEPENPAPAVSVVAGSDSDADADVSVDSDSQTSEPASTGTAELAPSETNGEDSGSSTGLAVAGIVLGVIGIGVGGVALARSSRQKS